MDKTPIELAIARIHAMVAYSILFVGVAAAIGVLI